LCLSVGNRRNQVGIEDGFVQQKSAQSGCTGLSGGAPDSVRCARLTQANLLLSGNHRRRTAIIHRTVRCAPNCPVSQRPAGPTVGRVICARRVAEPTARRGHRTVRCAPDSVRCANGSKAPTVGFAKEGKKSAPDSVRCCPVRQATEGKNCLPGMLSMAPSCLGAIKGTPRRMEEDTKHSLSIPKHQDFDSTHLIRCDSN
jgi:hypothetical protein